ncbi:hypothetical protein IJM86_06270 [bacterium]|nr:hypothetical protein [bacterium]
MIKGELAKTPQIHQIWSGTFQEYLPRSGRYYQPEQIAGECTYTCKNKYAYKIDS